MTFLIVARAIQGIGAAGLFVAIMATIAVVTTVEKRSAFMAGFGFAFVVSSVIGPLLGGVFTEQLSWRWCFWINLPIGGIASVAIIALLPARPPERTHAFQRTGWAGFLRMDWLGCGLSLSMVTCLLIALQWGGNDYPWGNWRIILLFTLSAVLTIVFFLWEHWLGERALIPPGILRNRTVVAASGTSWMIMMAMLGGTYQLPLYYQAAKGHSAQKSGIDIIPFMVVVCVGIFISSGFVTKFGRYYPFFFIGPPIAAVGFGMLYMVNETTPNKLVIAWQVLSGLGIGLTFQNIILSVQVSIRGIISPTLADFRPSTPASQPSCPRRLACSPSSSSPAPPSASASSTPSSQSTSTSTYASMRHSRRLRSFASRPPSSPSSQRSCVRASSRRTRSPLASRTSP